MGWPLSVLVYQTSSAELPAAEYSTSMMGPVRVGSTNVPRCSAMRPRIVCETSKKCCSMPTEGRSNGSRPGSSYAPGAHMKYSPKVWTFMENRMLSNVSHDDRTACRAPRSGSQRHREQETRRQEREHRCDEEPPATPQQQPTDHRPCGSSGYGPRSQPWQTTTRTGLPTGLERLGRTEDEDEDRDQTPGQCDPSHRRQHAHRPLGRFPHRHPWFGRRDTTARDIMPDLVDVRERLPPPAAWESMRGRSSTRLLRLVRRPPAPGRRRSAGRPRPVLRDGAVHRSGRRVAPEPGCAWSRSVPRWCGASIQEPVPAGTTHSTSWSVTVARRSKSASGCSTAGPSTSAVEALSRPGGSTAR
jgi:hypothetical protein